MDRVISYKKQIIGFIALILLLAAIPITMYLTRQQQILRSRAEEGLIITLLDHNNTPLTQSLSGVYTTTDNAIKVQITYTPATTPSPIPTPSPTPTPGPSASPTPSLSPNPVTLIAENWSVGYVRVLWSKLEATDTNWYMGPISRLDLAQRLSGYGCVGLTDAASQPSLGGICFFSGLSAGSYVFALVHNPGPNQTIQFSNEITVQVTPTPSPTPTPTTIPESPTPTPTPYCIPAGYTCSPGYSVCCSGFCSPFYSGDELTGQYACQ